MRCDHTKRIILKDETLSIRWPYRQSRICNIFPPHLKTLSIVFLHPFLHPHNYLTHTQMIYRKHTTSLIFHFQTARNISWEFFKCHWNKFTSLLLTVWLLLEPTKNTYSFFGPMCQFTYAHMQQQLKNDMMIYLGCWCQQPRALVISGSFGYLTGVFSVVAKTGKREVGLAKDRTVPSRTMF